MCDQINPELRSRMIREMSEEIRKWFHEWRWRHTVTGVGLQRTCPRTTNEPQNYLVGLSTYRESSGKG